MHAALSAAPLPGLQRPGAPVASPCSTSGVAHMPSRPQRAGSWRRHSYQTDRDRELGRNVPDAPPMRVPPPPPPPPPPPTEAQPIVENELAGSWSRRGLLGVMLGGTVAYGLAVRTVAGPPLAAVDKQRNIALLKTAGGNTVAATQDAAGRVFMFDRAGNIYYDTEDPRTGLYIVDTAGEMTNMFVDKQGQVQRVAVGNIRDLRTVGGVEKIGDVPVRDLAKSIKGLQNGRLTGFRERPDAATNGEWSNLMPPNAPYTRDPITGKLRPPPMLEDYEIELQPRGGGGFFGGGGGGGGDKPFDPNEVIKTLQRGDK